MASQRPTGPQAKTLDPVPASIRLSPADIPSQIELLISLQLHLWPALSLAIQNAWGGSAQESKDKRDWFAGAVGELILSNQLHDVDDLEEVLLQVMSDEFEVVVDDGSAEETARAIWMGVAEVRGGEGRGVRVLIEKWERRRAGGEQLVGIVRGEDRDAEETDWDEDESEEEWNGFADSKEVSGAGREVDMDDAPPLVDMSKRKPEPEIDDEGFTKVVGKKKR